MQPEEVRAIEVILDDVLPVHVVVQDLERTDARTPESPGWDPDLNKYNIMYY